MKLKRILIQCLVVLLFNQCKKEEKPYQPVQVCSDLSYSIDTIKYDIEGSWEWLETEHYDRSLGDFAYRTPGTEGYVKYMNLTGNRAIVHRISANQKITTYTYKIQRENEITNFPEDTYPVLVLYNVNTGQREEYFRVAICKDFLITIRSHWSDWHGDDVWKRL